MGRSKNKSGQEEFVGFAIIIVVVAVVILIFLSFALRSDSQKEPIESYEVESFIQTALQYTTTCEDNLEYLPMQKLIFKCIDKENCLGGESSCQVMEETLEEIARASWKTEEGSLAKGYELVIVHGEEEIFSMKQGNETGNYRGAQQYFSRGGEGVEIQMKTYY